jgi:accessory secretory protein Asp2
MVVYEDMTKPQEFIDLLPRKYFTDQFGQKLPIRKILYSPLHNEKVWFEGNKYISTNISYGDDFRQLLFWKLSIPYDNQYDLELWMEYKIEEGCSIELDIQFIESGSADVILFQKRYSEEELSSPIVFSNTSNGYLICSVFVKGTGLVQIGPIHYRHARLGAGDFLPGGKRLADKNRQELFYYFYPGNLKPPLNVYFCGHRSAEGFEGYYMMKSLGHPFLLITDPRMEFGSFYVGSDDLENQLQQTIRSCMDLLKIEEEDLIFSGLSMGSCGALYYGIKYKCQAIIVCNPIPDIKYVAERTRLVRPYEFLTSLDLYKFWDKTDDKGNPVPLDVFHKGFKKQWTDGTGYKDTKLIIAYMEQDDYDDQAYYKLLESQSGKEITIIARGYQGRHNDQNKKIVDWFTSQYTRVIKEYLEK